MSEDQNNNPFTTEKSIREIYLETLKLRPSTSNNLVFFVAAVFFTVYVCNTQEAERDIIIRAHSWASVGLSFSTTVLGFLIAGFTIFSSFTSKSLFIRSAFIPDPNTSGLTYLKSFFFVFMKVFIHYVSFVLFSFLVYFLLGEKSVLYSFLCHFLYEQECSASKVVLACSKISIIILGSWVMFLVMLLKSFIFNVYYTVMTVLRYEYECKYKDDMK